MEKCANPKCENSIISKLNKYRFCHSCSWEWYEGGEKFARLSKGPNEVVCANCGRIFDKKINKGICPLCNHENNLHETSVSLKEKLDSGKV